MSPTDRAKQKQETRAGLLAAAARCFARSGWSQTVVSDVAREAGVAHGTFYLHFQDKDAIADALLADFNRALAARIARAVGECSGREARVRAAARTFLAALAAERAFVGWYGERVTRGLAGDALAEGINPEARALLDDWLAREGVDAAHRTLLSLGLLALWLRIGLRTVLASDAPRAAEDVLVATTLGAIEQLETIRAGQPLETIRAGQPLENIRAEQPLENIRAEQPLENIRAEQPLETGRSR